MSGDIQTRQRRKEKKKVKRGMLDCWMISKKIAIHKLEKENFLIRDFAKGKKIKERKERKIIFMNIIFRGLSVL